MQTLRVIAVSIGLAMTANSHLFCQIPAPIFPADQGTMQTFDALQWTSVPGATSYDVTMSTNPGFTALYNYTGITTTSYTPGSLRSGQQYFWTVRARIGATIGAWSDTVSFSIVTPGFNISAPILPDYNLASTTLISVVDLTGTGKKELLFPAQRRSTGNQNLYRARIENGTWTVVDSFYKSVGNIYLARGPSVIDVDNDGDPDIVFSSGVLWNEGGSFAKQGSVNFASSGGFVEQGNDGLFDLSLSTGFTINKGNREFEPGTTYIRGIPIADFDKDNRVDWIDGDGFIGYSDPHKDTVAMNYWTGDFNLDPNSSYTGQAAADIDGNGWTDLVTLQSVSVSTNFMPSIHYFDASGHPSYIERPAYGVGQVGYLEFGDMNNDGAPDLLYLDDVRNQLAISYNYGNRVSLPGAPVFQVQFSEIANATVGDVDNDNDLDIILTDDQGYLRILENTSAPNTPPLPPTMLRAKFLADTVYFKWHPGTDAQQSPLTLQNNLRVGTTKYGSQVFSANSDSISGNRFVFNFANAYQDTSWQLRKILPGKYFYSAQSIDNSRVGSAFSNIDSIFVCAPVTALLPKDRNGASDTTLLFKWTSAIFEQGYQLQVAYDSAFAKVVADSLTPDTSLLVRNLPADTLLFWHVRSYNSDGQSAWTTTRSFDTKKLSIGLNWDYSATLCNTSRGMGVNVSYKGFWEKGNQFILEINGRILKTITDSVPPDVINVSIRDIPLSTGSYKMRLRSTQPAYTSYESPSFKIQVSDYTAYFVSLPAAQCIGTNAPLSYYELSNTSDSSHWFQNGQQIGTLRYPNRGIYISWPGYYRVDAYSSDCMAIDSFTYLPTDCYGVWPGDANSDTKVDEVDVFTLGRNFGKSGPARSDQGNEWRSHAATNWPGLLQNYFNLKHSDCNGDGTLDQGDTTAISKNYGLNHPFQRKLELVDSLPQTSDLISTNFDRVEYNPGQTVTGSVIIGSASKPLMVSGLSFDLLIPDSLIKPGTFKITIDSSGVFYYLGPNLILSRDHQWIIHSANNKQVRGYGSVAKFSFVLNNISAGSPMTATVDNVIMTNLNGYLWTPIQSRAALAHSANIITAINNPVLENSITVWPNPVINNRFYVRGKMSGSLELKLRLFDSQGRQIEVNNATWMIGDNQVFYVLPAHITTGVYILHIDSKKGSQAYKLIVL